MTILFKTHNRKTNTSPMKPNHISPQSLAAVCALPAIMAFSPTLSAQEAMPGTGAEQIVTFAFTETYEDPALKPRDENGVIYNHDLEYDNEWATEKYNGSDDLIEKSEYYEAGRKQVTVKFSNKELLQDLVDDDIIEGPITGWAVKFVTEGDCPSNEYGTFYAVKSGSAPVDLSAIIIDDRIDGYDDAVSAATASDKRSSKGTYKYNSNGDATETRKETWSFSKKEMSNMGFYFSFDGYSLSLDGIMSEAWSVKSFGAGESQYWQYAPGAAKFDSGTGSRYYEGEFYEGEFEDGTEDGRVLKGTISLSAGKLFPNIYVPYPDFEVDYDD